MEQEATYVDREKYLLNMCRLMEKCLLRSRPEGFQPIYVRRGRSNSPLL